MNIYSSIKFPVRRVLYDFTLSGLLTQACLCAVKPSCSGVGITGIMPIETVTWPGIASSLDTMGLGEVSSSAHPASPKLVLSSNLLPIYSAKPTMYRISAGSGSIFKEL
jgi:hypothetical protein